MANLIETPNYDAGIYQIELTDPVVGGADGISNLQAKALANRTAYLKAQTDSLEATKAPLASPAFTGTPTVPTPAVGNNSTQTANTAFVQAAIAALVASSPAALDTLNELAAALGNDSNFAATITAALATKAPLASPALTGTPTVPTAGAGNATTQAASTAFVQTAVANGGAALLANTAPANLAAVAAVGVATSAARADHVHALPPVATTLANGLLSAADKAKLDVAAPLASPAFTGTPTVPTAGAGNATTQAASTAFVQNAIAALVASSPAALDTLNELAAALGNDPNFAATITAALAAKAPLASPAFTGTPTVPTAAVGSATTQAASTAFVDNGLKLAAPAGAVMSMASSSAPSGWLKCNGAAISRSAYAALFTAIGTTFGAGDGVTTFNLPDLRGEFLRGWDDSRGVDSGRTFGTWQTASLLMGDNVANSVPVFSNVTTNSVGMGWDPVNTANYGTLTGRYAFDAGSVTNWTNGRLGGARPRNIAMLFCIKY